MAETLGTLADKLTTVKLKLRYTNDAERVKSLKAQEQQLQTEMDEFVAGALSGSIPLERLTFAANKVYRKEGNEVPTFTGSIGQIFSQLAEVNAREFITTNVLGTQMLLDAARERCVQRFVHISTDEVMGSLPENASAYFTEDTPFQPNSPYAASKAAAEHLVRAAHHTFGLDTVITRCGNNYGPRQFPEKFLPLMLANAMNDEAVPVYGDGRNVRDWIYVDDHCRGILAALQRGRSGATYNIGARNERRNIDVARSVLSALGKPESLIQFVKDRPGHDRRYAIDPTLIETELGWRPRETWESGLGKTIDWYRANTAWLNRVRSGAYREYYARQYKQEATAP